MKDTPIFSERLDNLLSFLKRERGINAIQIETDTLKMAESNPGFGYMPVQQAWLSQVRNGKITNPGIRQLATICAVYNISLDYFFDAQNDGAQILDKTIRGHVHTIKGGVHLLKQAESLTTLDREILEDIEDAGGSILEFINFMSSLSLSDRKQLAMYAALTGGDFSVEYEPDGESQLKIHDSRWGEFSDAFKEIDHDTLGKFGDLLLKISEVSRNK
jgi:transcriptional regulator with XRE-family HTH domain